MKYYFFFLLVIVFYACSSSEEKNNAVDKQTEQSLVDSFTQKINQYRDCTDFRLDYVMALDSLSQYDAAINQLDTLLMTDSLNSEYWLMKAQFQESNRDTVEAINSYEKAIIIYPSETNQLYLANLLAEKKDKDALVLCTNVARMGMGKVTDANCSFIAGVYYARTGQNDKAIALFEKAINDNYTLMEAYLEQGFIYYDLKNFSTASAIFEKAITVNKMYADAYYWKAKCDEELGKPIEAKLNYQRAAALDKSMTAAVEAINRLDKQ